MYRELMKQSDELLVQHILEGNEEAMSIMVERHRSFVLTCICQTIQDRYLAEDIAQEVFVKAYRHLHTFRGDSKFTTWLYRLTKNQLIDSIRRQHKGGQVERMEPYHIVSLQFHDVSELPEEQVMKRECCEEVRRTLRSLPDKYRMVMELYHMRERTYAEIAEMLKMPIRTVETRLYRAKTLFKRKWTENVGAGVL
ncbi:RNA polymerase sigma factor [Paenibacillus apiarius]|uniref:Sigma-70 family RNA polymerase sigma factor n=1 Tax=Paenibacillus apiarius TaxID=46240 RepID=A0ABT4DP06_9BACL|nr:sigma-70 family RNA polymerase sigma factor [Paenibacillus apiarius]MCY9512764.1 sigma-70 family RNA polymerase sigma factor [Paenibacillus apiarius]MCY9519092.1 sigma-70 family RNA polymerase sigma factor [Paenibacillus apiarius]MCY9554716.1 sigma-70 family RNA polymerase sigma factor [Paenibacillus apiarius]MCY9559665.1 sigma-70 family RNA polymerase sigma factor [Paenibacillus apiarius]MCY9681908.1 sigma-70 family RNA polymerase sigma factor [Paenibacillus apiarius]